MNEKIHNYTVKEAMKKVMEYMQTEPVNLIEMVTLNTMVPLMDKEEYRLFVRMTLRFFHKNHNKIFLLAENKEALELLKAHIEKNYNGIEIAETATVEEHGKSDDMLVNRINGAEADCVIAALPSPLQEELVQRNRLLLNVRIWFGLGTELRAVRGPFSGKKWLKTFFSQHIVKKKIEKEQKQKN